MDVTAVLDTDAPPAAIYPWVAELERYPQWLEIVSRVEPAPAREGDEGPAWLVVLRGKIGPLARSKRVRMVRIEADEAHAVAFERREADGHHHAEWILRARIETVEQRSQLTMTLHYGGGLMEPIVDRLLRNEISAAKARLAALLQQ